MKNDWKNTTREKGQGALEYLLLIGGAVLIATIVLLVIISSTGSTNDIINNNLGVYQSQVTLGATGGGTSAVCGNGNVQSGEACDDGDLTNGDGCSSTCTVESGWSCSGNPSVCNPIPPGAPAFSFSAATGSGAHQVDLTWNITSNFDGSAYNVVKGWIGSSPAITDPVSFQSASGEDFTYNVTVANSSSPVFGTASNVGYTVYMVACNGAGVTNSNCTLSSVQNPVSGYDAVLFEAENMVLGAGLQVTTQSVYTFIHSISGSCNVSNNFATLGVALDNDGSGNTSYDLWGLVRNANNTNPYNFNRTIDPAAIVSLSIPVQSGYIWIKGPVGAIAGNGTQTARVVVPCPSVGTFLVEKLLYTTDSACVPTGDGSNCV